MVIISRIPTTIIIICLEKVFILCFVDFILFVGIIRDAITIIISGVVLPFLVFIFSLDVSEAVYINSVIIPEEKVSVVTNDSHLVRVILYIRIAVAKEMVRIVIAIYMGLVFFLIFAVRIIIAIDMIPLGTLDLQNQSSFVELLGIFVLFFLFFSCVFLFIFYNVHYVYLLLLLEGLLLGVFLYIIFHGLFFFGLFGLFLFLLVMVCLGGFSISLLVSLARF
jgi:hypothetical protein